MLEVKIEKILPVTEVRDSLNKIVDEVAAGDEMYVLTVNGKPSAVLVGVHHLEKLTGSTELLNAQGGTLNAATKDPEPNSITPDAGRQTPDENSPAPNPEPPTPNTQPSDVDDLFADTPTTTQSPEPGTQSMEPADAVNAQSAATVTPVQPSTESPTPGVKSTEPENQGLGTTNTTPEVNAPNSEPQTPNLTSNQFTLPQTADLSSQAAAVPLAPITQNQDLGAQSQPTNQQV